jgi:hypothetical protein
MGVSRWEQVMIAKVNKSKKVGAGDGCGNE